MSEKPEATKLRWSSVAWIAVVLIVLYPISVGPLWFLAGTGVLNHAALAVLRPIYAPLVLLGKVAPPFGKLLLVYDRGCHQLGARCFHR